MANGNIKQINEEVHGMPGVGLPAAPALPGVYPGDAAETPYDRVMNELLEVGKSAPFLDDVRFSQRMQQQLEKEADGDDEGVDEGDDEGDEGDEGDDEDVDDSEDVNLNANAFNRLSKEDKDIYNKISGFQVWLAQRRHSNGDLFPRSVCPPRRPFKCCVICLEPTRNRCQRCRSAKYCSKKCQLFAWPLHKADCNQMRYQEFVNMRSWTPELEEPT